MNDAEKQRNYELAESLLSEQNFSAAIITGAVAALLAALAYGMIITKWNFAYGFAMSGVGIVVGLAMQFNGRGINPKFAVAAAAYTVLGCVLGNLVPAILLQRAGSQSDFLNQTSDYLSLGNLIYFFIAVFAAAFLVKRPLSRSQRFAIGLYRMQD